MKCSCTAKLNCSILPKLNLNVTFIIVVKIGGDMLKLVTIDSINLSFPLDTNIIMSSGKHVRVIYTPLHAALIYKNWGLQG